MFEIEHRIRLTEVLFTVILAWSVSNALGHSSNSGSLISNPDLMQNIEVGQDTKKTPIEIKGYYRFLGYAKLKSTLLTAVCLYNIHTTLLILVGNLVTS